MTYHPPNAPEPPGQPPHPGQPPASPTGPPAFGQAASPTAPPAFGQPAGEPMVGVPMGGFPPAPPRRRNPMLWILTGVVALLVVCCGGGASLVYLFRDEFPTALDEPGPSPSRSGPRGPARPLPSVRPSPTPSAQPATENLKPGETLVLTSDEGDEMRVTITSPRTRKDCGASYSKPDTGAYLIVDVTMEVTRGQGTITPFDFTFLSRDSTTTDVTGAELTECGKDLDNAANMRSGTKRSGQLVFDVNPGKGQLVYKTRSRELAGSWKIG